MQDANPAPAPAPAPVPAPAPGIAIAAAAPAPAIETGYERLTRAQVADFDANVLATYGISTPIEPDLVDELREFCAHENTDGDGAWNDDDGTLDSLKPQGEAMARKAFKTMLQLGDEGEALGAAQRAAKAARRASSPP